MSTCISDNRIKNRVHRYPEWAQAMFFRIRALIFTVGQKDPSIRDVQETVRWGEPAYIANGGSAVRIDWKENSENSLFVYFNCKTKLITFFRDLYPDVFIFEKNRALVFHKGSTIPEKELMHCIATSLKYHHIKNTICL